MKKFGVANNKKKATLDNDLRKKLVLQAVLQHKFNCDTWEEGEVVDFHFEDSFQNFCIINVVYESGNIWRYEDIDLGPEGMRYKKITTNEKTVSHAKEKKEALDELMIKF